MLDKLLGETNLLFDSLNLKCIIGTAVHRFTCNMFFIVQHSTVYSSTRYVCYVTVYIWGKNSLLKRLKHQLLWFFISSL